MPEEEVRKETTVELVYPIPIPPPPVVVKKTAEMTNLDWKEVSEAMAVKLDTLIHPELTDISAGIRETVPIPYARFDITTFDRCQFW